MPRKQYRDAYGNRTAKDGASTEDRRKEAEELKRRFASVTRFVTEAGGWVVSIPGRSLMTIEVSENSDLPGKLRDLGYSLREIGRRERLAPAVQIEEIGKVRTLAHAGFIEVVQFAFFLD